jgi:hypothetical protein
MANVDRCSISRALSKDCQRIEAAWFRQGDKA